MQGIRDEIYYIVAAVAALIVLVVIVACERMLVGIVDEGVLVIASFIVPQRWVPSKRSDDGIVVFERIQLILVDLVFSFLLLVGVPYK